MKSGRTPLLNPERAKARFLPSIEFESVQFPALLSCLAPEPMRSRSLRNLSTFRIAATTPSPSSASMHLQARLRVLELPWRRAISRPESSRTSSIATSTRRTTAAQISLHIPLAQLERLRRFPAAPSQQAADRKLSLSSLLDDSSTTRISPTTPLRDSPLARAPAFYPRSVP